MKRIVNKTYVKKLILGGCCAVLAACTAGVEADYAQTSEAEILECDLNHFNYNAFLENLKAYEMSSQEYRQQIVDLVHFAPQTYPEKSALLVQQAIRHEDTLYGRLQQKIVDIRKYNGRCVGVFIKDLKNAYYRRNDANVTLSRVSIQHTKAEIFPLLKRYQVQLGIFVDKESSYTNAWLRWNVAWGEWGDAIDPQTQETRRVWRGEGGQTVDGFLSKLMLAKYTVQVRQVNTSTGAMKIEIPWTSAQSESRQQGLFAPGAPIAKIETVITRKLENAQQRINEKNFNYNVAVNRLGLFFNTNKCNLGDRCVGNGIFDFVDGDYTRSCPPREGESNAAQPVRYQFTYKKDERFSENYKVVIQSLTNYFPEFEEEDPNVVELVPPLELKLP